MDKGAYAVHKALREELESYINAQYFDKAEVLRKSVESQMKEEGVLYREPFIEASPLYKSVPDGISKIDLPNWMRDFLNDLSNKNLGVYKSPYTHQLKALEAFNKGKDIFVSTGTGSGKTECFIWPIICKLAQEAKLNKTWSLRGARVMIMYPMNALVSDQLSRLRRIMGDPQGEFLEAFQHAVGNQRRPQFGMYTGRTAYPGLSPVKSNDDKLRRSLSHFTAHSEEDEEYYRDLLKQGRVPAKYNLDRFIEALKNNEHITDPLDAEMITRFEMQRICPDILITNYSMLEYMLMRPQEQQIWNSTRTWLHDSKENKLLFVIDEAHMYRGSSGGEVALLIRRLMNKLQITRDQMQFILTTASMPDKTEEDRSAVKQFAYSLTAQENDTFVFLKGERVEVGDTENIIIPEVHFDRQLLVDLDENEEKRLGALNRFWTDVKDCPAPFDNLLDAEEWMFQNLNHYQQFKELMNLCRGNAISINELAKALFPDLDVEKALNAVSVILAIAPIAKYRNNVLFPARMHMLFRAIKAVYACTNETCPHAATDGKLTLGDVFLSNANLQCPTCGSSVYELINDRRCGALFYKGYINSSDITTASQTYLWRYPGMFLEDTLKEIHLYIPPQEYSAIRIRQKNPVKPCYLEKESGFISFNDDTHAGDPRYRKLYYCEFESPNRPRVLTYSVCPHCDKTLSKGLLTPFHMRGNESFYNLIRSQFESEAPVPGKDNDLDKFPNQGRKVLLFSDSRQRAARLARDMSNASDTMACRALFTLAIKRMIENDPENATLDEMYGYFVLEAALHHIQLFNGQDRNTFLDQQKRALSVFNRATKRHRQLHIEKYFSTDATNGACEQLINLFCGPYNTMSDSATVWLEPTFNELDELMDQLDTDDENGIKELFNAWISDICENNAALGQTISDIQRRNVISNQQSFGLGHDWKFRESIRKTMNWEKGSEEELKIHKLFSELFLEKSRESDQYYVNLKTLMPKYDLNHKWIKCEKCANTTAYALRGRCPICQSSDIHEFTERDFSALTFWRKPIFDALEGQPIRVIDTEEHTAQLSYKDERDETWSKTEQYEMRFQDLISDDEAPVDILSSTTTMEVGIDIGSLVAIGLRNIPPMRENYQQRAGRAGRRGSSLSTILTFCEDGPHDAMYFQNPEPMFRGDPRRPWIDLSSKKLMQRHLAIVMLEAYFDKKGNNSSIDLYSAAKFLDQDLRPFILFLKEQKNNISDILLPSVAFKYDDFTINLEEQFDELNEKYKVHPELYLTSSSEGDDKYENSKSLLDALFEEGIIPTFSFPKNVVSATVMDKDSGRIKYQVQRGLDIAISEYAPGRAIVVDKQTFQIGGIFDPNVLKYYKKAKEPAASFMEDENYLKKIVKCSNCGWFGLESDEYNECPFCGQKELMNGRPMLKPWGFGPLNGKSIPVAQLNEEYTYTQKPLYSTVPEKDEMKPIEGFQKVRIASRYNQRIIMVNPGNDDRGFVVCNSCGAAMPIIGISEEPLKNVDRPYLWKFGGRPCRHEVTETVSLGYDFKTDMMVLEFQLDEEIIDTNRNNPWIDRSATSLAEALRLSASRLLDIEFTELNSGYRVRNNKNGIFIDVYLYDSLSSGAGYSVSIATLINELLSDVYKLLKECDCETACTKCLNHFRNQMVQDKLDRFAALELLKYGETGKPSDYLSAETQYYLIKPIIGILEQNGVDITQTGGDLLINKTIKFRIYPSMRKPSVKEDMLNIPDVIVKYAKPFAYASILRACGRKL